MRAAYEALMNNPGKIEAIFQAGAVKARAIATPFMAELRHAVGLRDLRAQATQTAKTVKLALPVFKQYRETDGQFYFKLQSADGKLLLQSNGFAAPKVAGQIIATLQAGGASALVDIAGQVQMAEGVASAELEAALQALREARAELKVK
jgi:tryptophanyl-tRNA synthetase